ncbi:MAG: group II intron reverse transcriptase/maturase [Candidatus Omnitrophica bacterium]|nr:group II intron reverse transcriptase/maturase [Candidatus Omnitrophota bacterium]MCG2704558.1 group II intron reverse transcriptase/maturase [Candidatus Omnitrophota bacterium]
MTDKTPTKRNEISETVSRGKERNSPWPENGASNVTVAKDTPSPNQDQLMEQVVERGNMTLALCQVEKNKGAPGIDGMTTENLRSYLHKHWPKLKDALLNGTYKPNPVRAVEIPKPGNRGVRTLGIPTVLDRLIQQAIHQVLSPIFDLGFSESSYGFRPNRSAHMAVRQSQNYVTSGKVWVVDIDLEKFFDRVNHDILMARIARKVKDKRILLLIRRYLQSGVMQDGLESQSVQGTPQGGPLSPLLSNILLDDLDKELERRGHAFCRYADDCNIYVGSRQSGERVLKSITDFLERKLKLKVNKDKSAVDRPSRRKFLGYSMTVNLKPLLKAAPESWRRLKGNLKEIFRKGKGRNLGRFIQEELNPVLRGWGNYFKLNQTKIAFEETDSWIRRRLRCVIWRQAKRFHARKKKLMSRGLSEERAMLSAGNGRGPWWNAGASHMNEAYPKKYFDSLGLISLLDELRRIQLTTRTAVYGTVRTVV